MILSNKVAIITGAAVGIGAATSRALAKEGCNVVCNDISDIGIEIVREISSEGGLAHFARGDVAEIEDARNIIDQTIEVYGQLDILINNAGVVIPGKIDSMSIEDWDRSIAVNVRGPYLMSKFAIPHLKKTQGTIVNVSSAVALKGVEDRAAYTATKGALLALTRAMAADYKNERIRVNCICPGTTDTPSLADRLSKLPDPIDARKKFIERQPLGRIGRPEEIAEGIMYLVKAEFCTGTILSVDGGMAL
ncbi:MAG: SDR family NAD(P)-dependent oxidoreductase [Candidatus Thorarchaeota archaeon]